MPGHLFLHLDQLQWNHPGVRYDVSKLREHGLYFDAESKEARRGNFCKFNSDYKLNESYSCPLGCRSTKLIGSSASGYGADAYNLYSRLRDGMIYDNPIQAFPTVLGKRKHPPCKNLHCVLYILR